MSKGTGLNLTSKTSGIECKNVTEKFQGNLLRSAEKKICKINKEGGTEGLDKPPCTRAFEETDIENLIEEFHEILKLACSKSFRTHRASKRTTSNKSVPWWAEELTVMRKRLNALRRRYQRTRNNVDLRQQRKTQYLEGKARYAATIKKEKNQFMEGILQHDIICHSLERSI